MANITRIKNNQVTDNTIEYQKLKDGTLVGSKFNANLTLNSNVTILGNLTVANSFAQLNSINTYINDPLVVFNNNYTGSPTYDIGMLINRNLSSLAPYGAVNAAFVWKEADSAFEALMTTESGTTAGAINNSGWANVKLGNLTAVTATIEGTLTSGLASFAAINNTPVGNATPSLGRFTYLTADTGFSTANAVISGGYISALANATITTASLTNVTADNFYSGNVYVSGGYIQNLANVTATDGYITTLNSTNGNVTTLQVNNFNSGNIAVTGGYLTGIANVYVSTGYFTNLSTPNLYVTSAGITTLYAENFSSPNAVITGGSINGTVIGNTTTAAANVTTLNASSGVAFTSTQQSTSSDTGALTVAGGAGIAKNLNVGGNVIITGNLTVQGTETIINSADLTINDSIINLHTWANLAPLSADDGRDIGVKFHYYKDSDGHAFVGWANDTGYLEYYAAGTEGPGNTFIGSAYGTIKSGELTLANSTASTSYTSGALRVAGGAGIAGATYIGGGLQDTVIGNATPNAATVTQLNTTGVYYAGGNIVANSGTTSTSITTGAIVIPTEGGIGIGGNIHAGVYGVSVHNIRGNLLLGLGSDQAADTELTINLNEATPITSNAIVHLSGAPDKDAIYGADAFGIGNAAGFAARHARGTAASPLAMQAKDAIGAFTARGYGATGFNTDRTIFGSGIQVYANENFTDTAQGTYTTISAVPDGTINGVFSLIIGGNGETYVTRNTISTSAYTGALIVQGGVGIQGNLHAGAEFTATGLTYLNDITKVSGNLVANSQTESTSTTTGALVVVGGAGIMSNLSVGKSATFNANMAAGGDTYIKGINDETLIWAHPNSTYDQVVIGNSATNGDLVIGAKLTINSTDSMIIPVGTNAQRPSNAGGTDTIGMFRYNSTISALEVYDGSEWDQITTQFTVIVDEQFNGDDSTVEFTMSGTATTASTIVSINGVIQIPTLAYSVGGVGSNILTFTEAPAAGDVIDVRRLSTTSIVTGIASTNGYMQVQTDNNGVYIYTGVGGTTPTTYWEPNGAKVNSSSNISVASANTVTTLDSFSSTTYRSARYVVQVTSGAKYQVSEVLVIHDGTTATAVEYGIVQTNGNLGIVTADINSGSARLRFIASNSTNNVRITKDYNLI